MTIFTSETTTEKLRNSFAENPFSGAEGSAIIGGMGWEKKKNK